MFMNVEHGEDKEDREARKKVHKVRQQKNEQLKRKAQQSEGERRRGEKTCLEKLHEEFGEEYKSREHEEMYERATNKQRRGGEPKANTQRGCSDEFQNRLL